MADRQELIQNALFFLSDPNTQNHPITQRIAFLESKGLTNAEIEDVLKQSAAQKASFSSNVSYPGPTYPTNAYAPAALQPPPIPQRDWRDYFIMAIVSGGVMFGVVSLARKYLLPHLKPPSSTAYESDRDDLTAQFDAAAALIKDIQDETTATKTAVDEQREHVEAALERLDAAVTEMREGEAKSRTELSEIKEEVNNVRDMLPKMLEKNKESQSQALLDLQQELKSLKTLLLSRPAGGPIGGSSPANSFLGRRSIPSWQLGTNNTPTPARVPSPSPSPTVTVVTPIVDVKGKGKEKEVISPDASPDAMASSGVLVDEREAEITA